MNGVKVAIAVPVLNEEKVLQHSVLQIQAAANELLPGRDITIIIADNGSTDNTEAIGRKLAESITSVNYLRISERGKGRAIRKAWESVDADVYVFMDADLATDLQALPELVGRIESGAAAACGSRVMRNSYAERTAARRLISLGYRALLWLCLDTRLSDAPCGFKAFSATTVHTVMPRVSNLTWFFDSELIFRVARTGAKVAEIPVTWRDNRPPGSVSKVNIVNVAKEYLREVLRLRREVNTQESGSFNWRLLGIISVGLMVVTSIAPLIGWWRGLALGLEFTGRQSFAPGDTAAYLSYIAQARDGHILLSNLATTDPTTASPNPIWWFTGQISRLPGVTPLLAYHLMRLALIPALVGAFMRATAWFSASITTRRIAVLLACFSAGFGALLAPLLPIPAPFLNKMEWPIDLWVAEATPFASMYYSPHFVASWALLVMAMFLMSRALERCSLRDATLSGLAAALLLTFHPFYAVTFAAVSVAWFARHILRSGWDLTRASVMVVAGLITVPVAAYQVWLAWLTPNVRFMVDSNVLPTPSLLHVAIGFGGLALFAIPGALARSANETEHTRKNELVIWAIISVILIYSNLSFERRLVEGLHFPLTILAATVLGRTFSKMASTKSWYMPIAHPILVIITCFIFILSPFQIIARDIKKYYLVNNHVYLSASEQSAMRWIKSETDASSAFMSAFSSGQIIMGWGERRVFLGHWAMTPQISDKTRVMMDFYSKMTPTARAEFMKLQGINFVYFGPAERAIGTALLSDPGLVPNYEEGDVAVYERL